MPAALPDRKAHGSPTPLRLRMMPCTRERGRSRQFGKRILEQRRHCPTAPHAESARRSVVRSCANGAIRAPPSSGTVAAIVTAAFSHASRAIRCARSGASHARAVTKSASASESFATSAWRVDAGMSSRASSASRIAARWPWRSTMRSIENGAMSAVVILDQRQARFRPRRLRRSRPRPNAAAHSRDAIAALDRRAPLVATISTRSASMNSSDRSSTSAAISG